MTGFLAFLFIGLLAGWLAGKIMHGGGFGLVGNLVVGTVGALVGGFIAQMGDVRVYGFAGRVGAATLGAVVLLWLLKYIKKA